MWKALSSVPAVRSDRDRQSSADPRTVVPGPRVGEGTELIARALHPEAFQMKILVSWSSGKDSAWMLHVIRRDKLGTRRRC